jgi:hypothetical protein
MPPPTAQSAANNFETELEAQIANDSAPKFSWAWLNLPITLWILSAFGVSLLSFEFNGYSTCASEKRADNLQFSKLFTEIYHRRDRIALLENAAKSAEGLAAAVVALDPETTYIFKDFKGKKLVELTLELNSIVYKWNILSTAVTGTDVSAKQPVISPKPANFDLSTDYWTQIFQEFASNSGNISAALLFDAQAAVKNNTELDSVMDRIKSATGAVKNTPDIATFLNQQDIIQVKCFPRSLLPH